MTHYIVVSSNEIVKAEMERPEFKGDYFLHYGPQRKWEEYIKSLPRIAVPGHKWKLWSEVELDKDFRMEDQFWTGSAWWPTFHLVDGKVKPGTKTRTVAIPIQPTPEVKTERFKRPTDQQIVNAAILFNDGKVEKKKLSDMVALCDFVIDRLYENGDMTIPSSKENK